MKLRIGNSLRLLTLGALLLAGVTGFGQNRDGNTGSAGPSVEGKVVDASTGKGIVGVNISIGSYSAAITDAAGHFKIRVPDENADLFVATDGYTPKVVTLHGLETLTISLLGDKAINFQEEAPLHYRTEMVRNLPYALGVYNANDVWKKPSQSADALVQGRIAGLNAIRRSGTPLAGAALFLRGYNSLYATNRPLIIVDGMPYDDNQYGNSLSLNNFINPLNAINNLDIDNITVIKDASSMYGAKGANGVVIITTSRAPREATQIDLAVYTGFNRAPEPMPVMDAAQYREYLGSMMQSRGYSSAQVGAFGFMKDDVNDPLYYRYHNQTDWQAKVLAPSANQNYYLKVTGGDNIATYALSVGFLTNGGIIENTRINRYNTRFNAIFNFSKKFTGSTNLAFTYGEQNNKDQGISSITSPLFASLIKAPFFSDRDVNEKGVFSPNLADSDTLGYSNPGVLINNMVSGNRAYRFAGSFNFKYDFNSNVNASVLIGVGYDKLRENIFVPRLGVANDTLFNAVADSRLGGQVKRLFNIYTDAGVEYLKKNVTGHNIFGRVGLRYQNNRAEQDYVLGYNSATDQLMNIQNGVSALRRVGGGIGEWNWMNTYLTLEYNYRQKYFLAFNGALDASSRFGPDAKGINLGGVPMAFMPSIAAAWVVSSESFLRGLPYLRLRASYSRTGNDDIGNYSHRQSFISQNLLGLQGLVRSTLGNPSLQWETVSKINGGLDFSLLNERINFSADAFRSRTTDMLVYQPAPAASGATDYLANDGSMQNSGLELNLNALLVNAPKFKWSLNINNAWIKNKVLIVPGGQIVTDYFGAQILSREGEAAHQFYGYKTNGIYATAAEAASSGLSVKTPTGSIQAFGAGDVKFIDVNGDKMIDENDRQSLGSAIPKFYGGINNTFSFMGFELNALLSFSKGNMIYNHLRHQLESGSSYDNQLQSMVNRWRTEGQQTSMPKATWGDPMGNARFSDRWVEDGSYIRLRSVSLGYTVPIKEGRIMKSASLYVMGNNLLTGTKYLGFDPEFAAGENIFGQGVDIGLEPIFRTITLGAKLGF